MSNHEILPANDAALVRRMLAGDEQAFREFFDTYFQRVYRFALPRLGGNVESTREVVQSTLSKAMRNMEKYRGDAALFSWLCQICRHEIVDYLRAHKRRSEHVVLIDDSPELQAAMETIHAPVTDEPAHRYGTAETRRLVQAVLDRLPARYGDILEWKYIEGRSVEEIGQQLGVGHTAAQSLLARARQAFREALETVFGSTAPDILAGMLSGK
jgi:RNA polymerase sigma-70 factor (ECF subfamily)